jgi:hypothetical protein
LPGRPKNEVRRQAFARQASCTGQGMIRQDAISPPAFVPAYLLITRPNFLF